MGAGTKPTTKEQNIYAVAIKYQPNKPPIDKVSKKTEQSNAQTDNRPITNIDLPTGHAVIGQHTIQRPATTTTWGSGRLESLKTPIRTKPGEVPQYHGRRVVHYLPSFDGEARASTSLHHVRKNKSSPTTKLEGTSRPAASISAVAPWR